MLMLKMGKITLVRGIKVSKTNRNIGFVIVLNTQGSKLLRICRFVAKPGWKAMGR